MTDSARSTPSDRLPSRPRWLSPLWPLVLLAGGASLLLLDGARPYRTWWRRRHWKRVDGTLVQAYQRWHRSKMSGRGVTPEEYLERRPQKQVFEVVVERGWPLRRRKRVYRIRIHYTYYVGNHKHVKVADSPGRDFESHVEASRFLAGVVRKGKVRLWVDPQDPDRATAFLQDPWSARWVRLGLGVAGAAVVWLLVVLVLGHRIRMAQGRARRS